MNAINVVNLKKSFDGQVNVLNNIDLSIPKGEIFGLLVLPVILLLVGQMTGLLMLNSLIMLIAGVVILILDYVLIKKISSKFVPEKLI